MKLICPCRSGHKHIRREDPMEFRQKIKTCKETKPTKRNTKATKPNVN
uniref:Uncharacterized protein n=1 Tax=Anguilla anguilla TaxID=7936 RepID=A0A0E9U8W8_ANGAN